MIVLNALWLTVKTIGTAILGVFIVFGLAFGIFSVINYFFPKIEEHKAIFITVLIMMFLMLFTLNYIYLSV